MGSLGDSRGHPRRERELLLEYRRCNGFRALLAFYSSGLTVRPTTITVPSVSAAAARAFARSAGLSTLSAALAGLAKRVTHTITPFF